MNVGLYIAVTERHDASLCLGRGPINCAHIIARVTNTKNRFVYSQKHHQACRAWFSRIHLLLGLSHLDICHRSSACGHEGAVLHLQEQAAHLLLAECWVSCWRCKLKQDHTLLEQTDFNKHKRLWYLSSPDYRLSMTGKEKNR